MKNKPVRRSLKILQWFCPDHLYEELSGDLLQRYERDVQNVGATRARRRFVWNTIKFFRPGIILRNKFSKRDNQSHMLTSYLTVMLRHVNRHKFYSTINIAGLTVGIAFAMLIGAFVWSEVQVNQSLKDVERLYLLENKYKNDAANFPFFSPAQLGVAALEQYPTLFENYYRFWDRNVTISKGDKHFRIQTMIGDSTFLDMFGFKVLHGNAATALIQPFSIVVSEKTALQFFGKAEVIGETLTIHSELGGHQEFVITAVVADPEERNAVSDFMNSDAQAFLPIRNSNLFLSDNGDRWATDIITYVKLRSHANVDDAGAALNALMQSNLPDPTRNRYVVLDPLENYYLVNNNGAVQKLVISLVVTVVFVLLLAVANFINITIAGSFSRLREIGVRKVIGGVRRQIFFQFIIESIGFALFSGLIAAGLYELLRVYFGDALQIQLPSLFAFEVSFLVWVPVVIILIGVLGGIYPAIYLSSTGTVQSLKGKPRTMQGTINVSRGLIATQFVIAVFILVTAFIMSRQVSFIMETDLGYDKSFVLNVTSAPRLWTPQGIDKVESVKPRFLTLPEVLGVTISWGAPSGSLSPRDFRIYRAGQTPEEGVLTTIGSADEDYHAVFGLKVIEGDFLFPAGQSYSPNALVISETAQKKLGAKVGDKFRVQFFGDVDFTITGIVRDFHFESFHKTLAPVAFVHNKDFGAFRHFSFKVAPGNVMAAVDAIERRWKEVFPEDAFVYGFVDKQLENQYKTELQMKKAINIASVLIMLVMLTGVFGLVSLTVNKRTKEIGIRKVLGATSINVLTLISREYFAILIGAFVIGIPLSAWVVNSWLNGFAYHIDVSIWMFAAPVLLVFVLTLVTVGLQAFQKANANPVSSLRSE